jgi:hypothetical protein
VLELVFYFWVIFVACVASWVVFGPPVSFGEDDEDVEIEDDQHF